MTSTFRATYRIQFHRDFTFTDARALAPYLAKLGISHLYASPILMARAGSRHGYDVVDHARINPELGGEPELRALAGALRATGIGILLDIVPNHMAVGGSDNPYWLDLLEKGRGSVFANMFDIDWDAGSGADGDKLVVPMLGKPLAECVAAGEITLGWDARLGKLAFAYGDNRFPLRTDDYPLVVGDAATPASEDLARVGDPETLISLLSRQHFRLAYWKDAGDRINWRRFFDITNLAALRVEDDAVFEQTHAAIFRLFGEGVIDGVRVDHIDGLADPAAYCRRLRARLEALLPQRPEELPRERAIILVEKILADGEDLPADWDVDGTTGYDFMNAVSAAEHDPAGESPLTTLWTRLSERSPDFETEERRARREMLESAFANALRATAAAFTVFSPHASSSAIERAIALVVEHMRAYRTYAVGDAGEPKPGVFFDVALRAARAEADAESHTALDVVESVMRGERASCGARARDAVRRFNQLTAPVAAKAVEDTAFYRYGRLLSRNDVGFSPGRFSSSAEELHEYNGRRAATFPRTLVATATHDHKRGEDARARLAALSELGDVWTREVDEWFSLNAPSRPNGIATSDEYQLYQTLVGAWPLNLSPDHSGALSDFTRRILAWREKSLREAKLQTAWDRPNQAFEKSNADFVQRILDPAHPFPTRLHRFVQWLAPAGALNGLVSTVLRCTLPGVPDLYQGSEFWDHSLVDPDNRGRVDYETRRTVLDDGREPSDLLATWQTGAVKLALIARLLSLRALAPDVFAAGQYVPLAAANRCVFAFARATQHQVLIVAVPRLCAAQAVAQSMPLPDRDLGADCPFAFPPEWQERSWRDALVGNMPAAPLWDRAPLFRNFPAAILVSDG